MNRQQMIATADQLVAAAQAAGLQAHRVDTFGFYIQTADSRVTRHWDISGDVVPFGVRVAMTAGTRKASDDDVAALVAVDQAVDGLLVRALDAYSRDLTHLPLVDRMRG